MTAMLTPLPVLGPRHGVRHSLPHLGVSDGVNEKADGDNILCLFQGIPPKTGAKALRCPATAPEVVPLVAGCGFAVGHGVGVPQVPVTESKLQSRHQCGVFQTMSFRQRLHRQGVRPLLFCPAIQGGHDLELVPVLAPRCLSIARGGLNCDAFTHPWLGRTHTAELLRLPCDGSTYGYLYLLLAVRTSRLGGHQSRLLLRPCMSSPLLLQELLPFLLEGAHLLIHFTLDTVQPFANTVPYAVHTSPPRALTHSRLNSSVSHPLVHSSHEHLTRCRSAISYRRPHFSSLAHTRLDGLCRRLPAAGTRQYIYRLGRLPESSLTRELRRGGPRRQPVSPEHSCLVAKCIGNSSRREERSVTPASPAVVGSHGIPRRRGSQEAANASFHEEGRARALGDLSADAVRRGECGSSSECKRGENGRPPKKPTCLTASSGTIPICVNMGTTSAGYRTLFVFLGGELYGATYEPPRRPRVFGDMSAARVFYSEGKLFMCEGPRGVAQSQGRGKYLLSRRNPAHASAFDEPLIRYDKAAAGLGTSDGRHLEFIRLYVRAHRVMKNFSRRWNEVEMERRWNARARWGETGDPRKKNPPASGILWHDPRLRKSNPGVAPRRRESSADRRDGRPRIRLERAFQKQSIDTHKTPYDRVKRCRERKINVKAPERVNVEIFIFIEDVLIQPQETDECKKNPIMSAGGEAEVQWVVQQRGRQARGGTRRQDAVDGEERRRGGRRRRLGRGVALSSAAAAVATRRQHVAQAAAPRSLPLAALPPAWAPGAGLPGRRGLPPHWPSSRPRPNPSPSAVRAGTTSPPVLAPHPTL
ncbi:hypothetical protein PR048_010265 [Dryococelus australis]|uniref:Uncharacterized protein n=1 Tax=Dryococelus australis TaxID=614101 RepID=A0ABQ9I294_9NEOP|nr:hypothetical protein PR048_010265 [Dryococelus australis]